MAYPSGAVTTSIASTASRTRSTSGFIPELWGDEVIATYESNLVLANLIKRIPFAGKKGDTIHIPNFATRGTASVKAAGTIVNTISQQAEETPILIDKHYEYSVLIDDIASLQALDSMRQFYTSDAGYALARQVDQDLFKLAPYLQGGTLDTSAAFTASAGPVIAGDGSTAFDGNASGNVGNASTLTDAGIRRMIQTLDDSDVPMEGRVMIIPPVERKNLLGLARFTEQAFVGDGSAIKTGNFGNIYGIPVYVSTNCPWIHVDSADGEEYWTFSTTNPSGTDAFGRSVTFGGSGSKNRVGLMIHRDAWALAEQQAVRVQTQYKQEYLADLMTADTVYGVGELRPSNGVAFVVPA